MFTYDASVGQFALNQSDLNRVTYNFFSPDQGFEHVMWDVVPWIFWGNTEQDTTFTPRARLDLAAESLLYASAGALVDDVIDLVYF
ncbi:MAG: hypothetical protein AB8B51_12145 [Sedimentitalea sp.]